MMKIKELFLVSICLPLTICAQHNYDNQSVIYSNNNKVGIGTTNPQEAFQIGDRWTFHSGGYKTIGYNFHYSSGDKRIVEKESSSIVLTGSGDIYLRTAPFGNAGSSISWMSNLILKNNGSTGFGISNPEYDFDIVRPFVSNSESTLFIGQNHNFGAATGRYGIGISLAHTDGTAQGKVGFLNIWSGGSKTRVMSFAYDGKVGIGTSNPDFELTVNGTIHAKEVKVDLSVPGPDYVFEEDYDLPSLESIQYFIQENKHLPDVPSASEMEEKGIDLGVMNMLLLKKVEELTLYTLLQEKKITKLLEDKDSSMKDFQNKIDLLMLEMKNLKLKVSNELNN